MIPVEDIGNGSFSSFIVLNNIEYPCYFSIFNNAYGQICHIICEGKETRIDYNLEVINGFHPNTMPPEMLKIAIKKLLELLANRPISY